MAIWASLRERRVFPWLGAYIAAGFFALEGVDQLVGQAIVPDLAYKIVLIFYLAGIPGTAIIAWFHGAKGTQKPPALEIWLQLGLLAITLAICTVVIRGARARPGIEGVTLDPRRIAVLYFQDLSRDSTLAYLADGLTETLIEQLDQVRALDVISRNGVAPFRGSDLPRDSIARALGVGTLIEGSVELAGERVRMTARLVDGTSGADLPEARRSFERPAGDLLSVSDSLAAEVAGFLRERLGEEVRLRMRREETSSTEAWALLQRAERLRKSAEESLQHDEMDASFATLAQADSVLALAEQLDPLWVEPVAHRAQIAYRRARLAEDARSFGEWTAVGLGHAERALALAPRNADALAVRGVLRYASWLFTRPADPEQADQLLGSARADLESATQADPTLAGAWSTLSHLYYQIGDVPAAVLAARRAYEEDAYLDLANEIIWRLFNGSLDLEQFAQADRWCAEGVRRFPGDNRFALCRLQLMTTPAQPPDPELAWELAASLDTLTPEPQRGYRRAEAQMMAGGVLARAGLPDSARSVLLRARSLVTAEIDPEQELLTVEAYNRTLLGDFDEAVNLLKRYVAANPGHFEAAAGTSWWWRSLAGHPGFQELLGTSAARGAVRP
jgi:serine/threonine-protein kinase